MTKTRAFIFPGQGSQVVGMGKKLSDRFLVARDVFHEVDNALSQNLSQIMFEGPESELRLTENAQPAIMAVSLALVRILEKEGNFSLIDHCAFVSGHSLGEYSALAAVDTFSIADAALLLKIRGKAMQDAVPIDIGAMAAIIGINYKTALDVTQEAAQGEICTAANDNTNQQVVISGHKKAIKRAIKICKQRYATRAVLLPVSAPFHCCLMQPAADKLAYALESIKIKTPKKPIISNVTATKVQNSSMIRKLLIKQIFSTVRWRESIMYMKKQGIINIIELGIGQTLTNMLKKIDPDLTGFSINNSLDIQKFINIL